MGGEMIARVLPPTEYGRLAETESAAILEVLPPGGQVVVVEDADGAIAACWCLFPLIHVEGVWIAPAHRQKGVVARRLLDAMRQTARRMGAVAVNTASQSAEVTTMLRKLGAVQLEGEHFSLRVL
jgi:N-acetylglutamate synthase-like GNAT family acetyltransferase